MSSDQNAAPDGPTPGEDQRVGAPVGRGAAHDERTDWHGQQIVTADDLGEYFDGVDPQALQRDRRRRRHRHGIVLGLLVALLAGTSFTAWQVIRGAWEIPGWEAAPPPEPLLCPAGDLEFGQASTVNVYNGTRLTGLAGDTADQLEQRQFTIGEVGNRRINTASMSAVISSGHGGRETAFALQRSIDGAVYTPDRREDDGVDVVVGTQFEGLIPEDQVDTAAGPLSCGELPAESASAAGLAG